MSVNAILTLGCSHDWDLLDPLGTGGSVGGGANSTSTSASTGGQSMTLTYPATVAECVNPMMPDPAACSTWAGGNRLDVDLKNEASNMEPSHAYLRFDLDGALDGKTIDAVQVELVCGDAAGDEAPMSGELYRVASFSLSSLQTGVPAIAEKVAEDRGGVTRGATVAWLIPPALVKPNGTIYLGLFPTTNNGVHYWNNSGAVPPKLVIFYH
jgi:hypothetical protein